MKPLACLAAALLGGCSPAPPAPDELEHSSEGFAQLQYIRPHDVDILIVLDNSSSMAEEQALLAANLGPLIEMLEGHDFRADYRIAITTTDAGHPACPSSTPERGKFLLTPCTSRLDEFVTDGEGGPSDVRAPACSDICGLDAADLQILPTTTDEDPTPRPRPWLERIDGRSNLPEGVEMTDALRCFAPQGVAGCDFEAPLESMHQALLRSQNPTDPAYGFLRKDAALLMLIVTDEDDCSVAPGGEAMFSGAPTSAVCWDAAVTCVGDPSGYDGCEATNEDLAGNEGVADADAVLQPLARYAELLDAIMADKRALDPAQRPLIAIMAGVDAVGELVLADVGDSDPEFQQTFGIGPGCEANTSDPDRPIRATPPVRLRTVLTALGSEWMFSVCENNWTPLLHPLGHIDSWWTRWESAYPACYPYCALDTDPTTSALEPDCIVEEQTPDSEQAQDIPACARDELGYVIDPDTNDYAMPSDDVHVCHALLTDNSQATSDPTDDVSHECSDQNFNLEFKVSRRPGHPGTGGTRVTATCSLSAEPTISCPGWSD
jgi:hypothetical protein